MEKKGRKGRKGGGCFGGRAGGVFRCGAPAMRTKKKGGRGKGVGGGSVARFGQRAFVCESCYCARMGGCCASYVYRLSGKRGGRQKKITIAAEKKNKRKSERAREERGSEKETKKKKPLSLSLSHIIAMIITMIITIIIITIITGRDAARPPT